MRHTYVIECEWDDDAKVWYVADSNVPGLVAEAATAEEMNQTLLKRVPELLCLNEAGPFSKSKTITVDQRVPFELRLKNQAALSVAC